MRGEMRKPHQRSFVFGLWGRDWEVKGKHKNPRTRQS
jgi:hypothetical protein